MPNIGLPELAIILVIVLLLFGASRLPKLGKSMGQGIRGFKDGLDEAGKDDDEDEAKQVEQASTAQASAQLPPAPQQVQPAAPVQPAPPLQQAPAQAQPPVPQQPAPQQPAQPAPEQPQGWTPQPPQPPTPPQA